MIYNRTKQVTSTFLRLHVIRPRSSSRRPVGSGRVPRQVPLRQNCAQSDFAGSHHDQPTLEVTPLSAAPPPTILWPAVFVRACRPSMRPAIRAMQLLRQIAMRTVLLQELCDDESVELCMAECAVHWQWQRNTRIVCC